MSSSYYRWADTDKITLVLQLVDPSSSLGVTGKSPEVAIRRHRSSKGGAALDDFFWNGSIFVAGATWLPLPEFDSVNNPGLYTYLFEQPGDDTVYLVYFRHTAAPAGFGVEYHLVSDELLVPASSPIVPILGDTVIGRLEEMKDPTSDVAMANADAVWDETLADHLLAGSTGEAMYKCCNLAIGSRKIEVLITDDQPVPLQGVQVDVRRTDNSFLGRVFTNGAGEVTLNLDDGSYLLFLFKAGYSFSVPEALVVTADTLETYLGTSLIVISPPSTPDLCVIYGTIRDVSGSVVAGACIAAFSVTPQAVAGFQHGDRIAQTITDSNGQFQMELVRNTTVRFTVKVADLDFEKVVPDLPSQDITTWV